MEDSEKLSLEQIRAWLEKIHPQVTAKRLHGYRHCGFARSQHFSAFDPAPEAWLQQTHGALFPGTARLNSSKFRFTR